jgi:DNA polymerase-3 subunit alpha
MPEFVHLHNHSDYSLLDGAAPIPKLVAAAKDFGMKHLALTDHGNMFGSLKFYKECKANGINPIVGSEFYVAPGSRFIKSGTEKGNKYFHLILLARNVAGYRNLMELTSSAYLEGFYYKPRIDEELLAEHTEGLIALSACIAGSIPQAVIAGREDEALQKAKAYDELFGRGNFYLELQDHGIPEQRISNKGLIEIARKTGIPLVVTNDIHYLKKEHANAQDILICIGTNKKKNETSRMAFGADQFYFKSADEMASLFIETPEAIENTLRIAESCSLEIPQPGPLLPIYEIPKDFESPDTYMRHNVDEGLKALYPEVSESIRARADYELKVIQEMGFTGYFLIVWDFINFARQKGIPVGPGRGSGAGSIVAYAMRITDIDPLKYNLLFERFLNPERVSMPDFDVDFCFERRQEVIDYVTEKYGEDKVAQICTFGTLKPKAVLKDVARVLDIPFAESNEITKLVPDGPKVKLKDAIENEPKLKEYRDRGGIYEELFDTAFILEGINRHNSTHACGMVIGRTKLTDYVPLYKDPKTGQIATEFTMEQLEDCGLVKMDFLGLKTLTLISNTEALIRKRIPDFRAEDIPDDDPVTFKMLCEGKSMAVFQFESQGMQAVLKRAKPNRIEDLIALNALYRPGPMAYIDQFVDSKSGKMQIEYPDPCLEPILKETYGVIVYQEQVMQVAQKIAGYSLGQADILRRAMGKKKPEVMVKEKVKFIAGAKANGFKEKHADEIFEILIPFAGYGFNKSHAAAYSVLAYKTAYLKANFPAEFMAANLTNEVGSPDAFSEYIAVTKEMGIELMPPDINLSERYFTVVDGKIVYGLSGVKNVGQAAVDEIVRARTEDGNFSGLSDFLLKVDLRVINRKVVETLILAGLFDRLGVGRATLMTNLERVLEWVTRRKESEKYGQTSLFDGDEETVDTIELVPAEEWPYLELLRLEKENLGFFFSGHPLDRYKEIREKCANLEVSKVPKASPNKIYTLLGMIKTNRIIVAKNGKKMAFAQLEDHTGTIELVFFTEAWEASNALVAVDAVLGIEGKVEFKRGDPKIIVERY